MTDPIAFTNYDIAGAFEPFPSPIRSQVNKKFTTDPAVTTYELYNGCLLAHDPDDTTKTEFVVAENDSERPFAMAFGDSLKQISTVNYLFVDSHFTKVAALNTDKQVPVLHYGIATMYIDGVVQPDAWVMPSDGTTQHGGVAGVLGHVQAWNGSDRKTICGIYRGLIGQSGGKYRKTATLDVTGQLGKIFLNAPGAQ